MTRGDFKYWAKINDSMQNRWRLDQITFYNRRTMLFYTVMGEDGRYIEISQNGQLRLGNFFGAYPNIDDAEFVELHNKKFSTQNEAIEYLILLGINFI